MKLLLRHRVRREQRVPTITCFTGSVDEARALLLADGPLVEIEGVDAATALAAKLLPLSLPAALSFAAGRAGRSVEALRFELPVQSSSERARFLSSLDLPEAVCELIDAWCENRTQPALELTELARILPRESWPALLIARPSDRALLLLAQLVEELPYLGAAVVTDQSQIDRAPPRVALMLREGLIRPWDEARDIARKQVEEASDPLRAKSAAEAFLFEVLEAMPDTRGLFALNARMDFDFGKAACEIDLADASHRLAIEIDGYFHFQDAEAYRRDRRKDLVLQRQSWLVLRFLAEDVVVRLEETIAVIRSAIAWRGEIE